MESFDLLLVGIEVSVAFAGFAGIVATFQFRDAGRLKRGDLVALTMIVQISLVMAFCCVLPIILAIFGLQGSDTWLVCSCFGATWQIFMMYSIDRNMRGAVRRMKLRILFGSLQAVAGLNALCQFLNIIGLVFDREPGPFIAGIVFGLTLVGYMFGRLLLRPLWLSVHEQETAHLSGAR